MNDESQIFPTGSNDASRYQIAMMYGSHDWDHYLTQRLRTLLYIKPLFEMLARHARRDPAMRHYDALMLALKVFDLIIETTGLDRDIDSGDVIQTLKLFMSRMDIAAGIPPDGTRHRAMAENILADLRNDEEQCRPFIV